MPTAQPLLVAIQQGELNLYSKVQLSPSPEGPMNVREICEQAGPPARVITY